MLAKGRAAVEALLRQVGGSALFELGERLSGCRVRKHGARLYSVASPATLPD